MIRIRGSENCARLACAVLTVGVIAIRFTSASAQERQYDDPAVAICEFQFKRQIARQIADGWEYERRSASLSGAKVMITAAVTILNTKPYELTQECVFDIEDGAFRFAKPPEKLPEECNEFAKLKSQRQLERGYLKTEDSAEYDECLRKVRAAEMAAYPNQFWDTSDARKTGIYPIDPDRTQLKILAQ